MSIICPSCKATINMKLSIGMKQLPMCGDCLVNMVEDKISWLN